MNKLTNGQTKMHNITPNTPHLIVPLTVAMHSSVTDIESAKEIKHELEDFYNEVSRSLEFNASELVEGYPYCPAAWLHIVANHDVTN